MYFSFPLIFFPRASVCGPVKTGSTFRFSFCVEFLRDRGGRSICYFLFRERRNATPLILKNKKVNATMGNSSDLATTEV